MLSICKIMTKLMSHDSVGGGIVNIGFMFEKEGEEGRVEAGRWLGGPSLPPERDGRPGLGGEAWLVVAG